MTPYNNAVDTFSRQMKALGPQFSDAAYTKVVQPLIPAIQTSDQQLLALQWPGQTETDVRALVTVDGSLQGDLAALEGANRPKRESTAGQMLNDSTRAQLRRRSSGPIWAFHLHSP